MSFSNNHGNNGKETDMGMINDLVEYCYIHIAFNFCVISDQSHGVIIPWDMWLRCKLEKYNYKVCFVVIMCHGTHSTPRVTNIHIHYLFLLTTVSCQWTPIQWHEFKIEIWIQASFIVCIFQWSVSCTQNLHCYTATKIPMSFNGFIIQTNQPTCTGVWGLVSMYCETVSGHVM